MKEEEKRREAVMKGVKEEGEKMMVGQQQQLKM